MYDRCPNCKNRTGFSPEAPLVKPKCPSCGYVFETDEDDPSPEPEPALVAAGDVEASASEESARPRGSGPREGSAAAIIPKGSPPYDPGFKEAVEAGQLTPRQAAERGDRMRGALKLVKKHQLSMDEAFSVTDNKKTLTEVLRKRAAAKPRTSPKRGKSSSRAPLIIGALLVVAAVVGVATRQSERSTGSAEEGAQLLHPAQFIQANGKGQVTAVIGDDPQAVLKLFCQSTSVAGTREPVKTVPAKTDWLGIFSEAGAYYSIRIRQNPMTGKYMAGDGSAPILPEPGSTLSGMN